jgi:hypothetical protein
MDFEMILNELSFAQPAQDIPTARQRMSQFIKTLRSPNIGRLKRVLRTHKEFHATELAPDYSLAQWRNDPKVDKYEQRFLRILIFKSPFLFELPIVEEKSLTFEFSFKEHIITNPNNQICGLGAAYLLDSLAVSVLSEPKWDVDQLDLQKRQLNHEGNIGPWQPISIYHASKPQHIEKNKVQILKLISRNSFDWANWQPSDNLLPVVNLSNQLVEDNWNKFKEELRHLPSPEKNAKIEEIAKNVAEINGYTYDQEVSAYNKTKHKLRSIYAAGSSRHKIYLSTDFETGAFEVCDHKGQHLGEYSFRGEQTKEADNSHNIKLTR